MRASRPTRLVYSSESAACPNCGSPQQRCKCAAQLQEEVPSRVVAKLRIEKSGRGGKTVTVIYGLPRNRSFVKGLAGDLKKACGSGGKAGESHVEVQGDKREAVRRLLQARGWTVKG